MRSVALVAMLALTGCNVNRSFQCGMDADCEGVGAGARCEADSFCSSSDDACESGRRYDEYAGKGLANDCVAPVGGGGDAGMDTMPMPQCPAGYTTVGTSKYRYVTTGAMWLAAEADCDDDGDGTHLAIISDAAENNAVVTIVGVSRVWLGITDRITQATYRTVTGDVQTYLPWEPQAPELGDDCVAVKDALFSTEDCADTRTYVCECDGREPMPGAF